MPSPKSGTPGTLVAPLAPEEAQDADTPDVGEMEQLKQQQRQTKTGKYGTQPVTPFTPPTPEQAAEDQAQDKKKSWIKAKLVDKDGAPVAGEPYEVTLPDGRVASGTTDSQGMADVQGFDPGQCKITFPNLDKTVVKPG
jgi:type VI secretion system secreted protein VgrG